jgi:competence ComEA-like helix-hairpin-helix protein
MPAWTPAERRGALLVALLLALGAARDLWRATHPRMTAAPQETAERSLGPGGNAAVARPGATAPTADGAAATVDLNQAGLAELDALPGIGPVLAGRILQHRNAHGPFREPEDLLAVPGIGPRLYERLRPRIRVGARPSAEAPRTARPGVPRAP